jgi:hypothetical protein
MKLMMKSFLLPGLGVLLIGLSACSESSNAGNSAPPTSIAASPTASANTQSPSTPTQSSSSADLAPLFSRIWRVTKAPTAPVSGSIYAFLPNGTLLQTSCGETYRIATWKVDKSAPRTLQVTEDKQQAYTAKITELTNTTLQLQLGLTRSNETQALTLTAVEQEFVCPDLPR